MTSSAVVIDRFLTPAHAAANIDIDQWHDESVQQTPGADAWCRLLVQPVCAHSYRARFLAYGPPAVIAAADWLCEQVERDGIDVTARIKPGDVAAALDLAASERHIGILVIDALATAASNLGR